jgi:hypothetical protein
MYPYHLFEDLNEYDEVMYVMKTSKKDGELHIPTFARRMLEQLRDVGLLHTRDAEFPANIRKVTVDKGQELWIGFDTYRSDEGYMAVDVVDAPRSDAAILAAMIAWMPRPVDFEQLLEEGPLVSSVAYIAQLQKIEAFRTRMYEGQDIAFDEWKESMESSLALLEKEKTHESVMYLLSLIMYYRRPEVKNYSLQEMDDLLKQAYYHINNFLEALRKLQGFFEYGTSNNKKLTPAVKEPQRDVKAAVLRDVDELNYRQIGERIGIPVDLDSDYFEKKGEHVTVRKMVARGRRILEEAFGEEGWRKRAEVMKAEQAWWRSLSREEQQKETEVEMTALRDNIPIEEARRWVERRQS